jgi:transcription initiation factor TFIID subunit TAF12
LDPSYNIDSQAEHQVLQLADDFLDKVCHQSLRLAQHRGSKTIDVKDIQTILIKQWGIVVPGLGPPVVRGPTAPKRKRKPAPPKTAANKKPAPAATPTTQTS